MVSTRRVIARVANSGLIVSGLALVVVLGTGGTRIDLGGLQLSMRSIAGPLQFFGLFAALRLLVASRGSGLEGRLVAFFARQGLSPRDLPATPGSAARTGAWIGAGFALVALVADLVHLLLADPGASLLGFEPLAAFALAGTLALVTGVLAGAGFGALAAMLPRRAGLGTPGRYEAGRWTTAALLLFAPFVVDLAPPAGPGQHAPGVLLGVAAAVVLAALGIFLLLPVAVLRARRGRWGLALTALGALVALGVVAAASAGPAVPTESGSVGLRPNVLIVSITGLRTDTVASYGAPASLTQHIDNLAQRGALFRDATTPSTSSAAAAASLLTGLYPASHGLRNNSGELRQGIQALPSLLAAHGYRTAAFVSSRALDGRRTGLGGLFHEYRDVTAVRDWLERFATGRPLLAFTGKGDEPVRSTGSTLAGFRRWLGRAPTTPWFAWVELGAPGYPRPQPWSGRAVLRPALADPDALLPLPPAWSAAADRRRPLRDWLFGYEVEIRNADDAVGAFQDMLVARGEPLRTIVLVTAGHGTAVGEQGLWFETGPALSQPVVRVPWIVAGPGIARGGVVAGPCSLVDVCPTVLGLLGLAGPRRSLTLEGEDLSRYIASSAAAERDTRSGPVFSESATGAREGGRIHAVWLGSWKLVRYPGGSEQLLREGEGGEQEVASPRGHPGRLRQELSDILTRRLTQEAHGL
ncbi:MAG: sulfatase-like hydrolase/transferase [Acidobacteria bacterium]|nr:sulfatase-like hydrolase/transferase [Acidobacteriota bacterium]